MIKNLYAKTSCPVKINGKRTQFFSCTKGLRQGFQLIIFNIFINGIVKSIKRSTLTL